MLIRQLSRRAWHEGIRRFIAMATADNLAAVRLLRTMSAQPVRRGAGAVEYQITLESWEEHGHGGPGGVPKFPTTRLSAPARWGIQPTRGDVPVFPQVPAAAIGSETQ